MRQPHVVEPTLSVRPAPTPAPASPVEPLDSCPVIRADRVILGCGSPRRLRVVCYENPYPPARPVAHALRALESPPPW